MSNDGQIPSELVEGLKSLLRGDSVDHEVHAIKGPELSLDMTKLMGIPLEPNAGTEKHDHD